MRSDEIKHFYIFRHGECPLNQTGHIQGQKFNGKLTDLGCKQAERVGIILQDKAIEVIVTSPMKRAVQTALIAKKYLAAIPIMVDHRLIEVNMGVVEGMHISLAEKKYADTYKHWRSGKLSDLLTHFEHGESKAQVRKRVFDALEHYAQNTKYKNIAISTHGIAIAQILQYFGIKKTNIPNGAVLFISYNKPIWNYEGFVE
ncbi:MAG: histidine phosphatase family protein [Alphaproteobacteria bacterium]|nr:histidine phosphatase family protein [Alphaproteobacteria bacterium]